MGIYYYAIDHTQKQYFSSPENFSLKSPGIFHPHNPFSCMLVMKNSRGSHFVIEDDCSNDIPPSDDYEDVTFSVYKDLLNQWEDAKEFYEFSYAQILEHIRDSTKKVEDI